MRICRSKKKNRINSILETLPDDVLINEVLRRVSASSLNSITNVKLSCKKLKEMGEDKCIYQHVSLDKIPIVEWSPLNKECNTFLNKCRDSGNPGIMYRQALVDYFTKINPNVKSIYEDLDRAVKLGHVGALYVTCIVLLFSGDEDLKREGIKLIHDMKKSASLKRELRSCRNKLVNELRRMWVNNPVVKERPVCCTAQHQRRYKNKWSDEEVVYECRACNADAEIKRIHAFVR